VSSSWLVLLGMFLVGGCGISVFWILLGDWAYNLVLVLVIDYSTLYVWANDTYHPVQPMHGGVHDDSNIFLSKDGRWSSLLDEHVL
jgi:hypothetical protein